MTYEFIEDGTYDKTYKFIYEWIREKQDNEKIILEHIGQYPIRDQKNRGIETSMGTAIFSTIRLSTTGERNGLRKASQEFGAQNVFGPYATDNFRYTCKGMWIGGQIRCEETDAAIPRRDRKRGYARMSRINTLQTNPKRWVHAQMNTKYDKNDQILSRELGWNRYIRVEDSVCDLAAKSNAQPFPRRGNP